ncbi:mucin-6 [Sagmatias obliquidens]|uniref:mucin-6 n=1 Tax=Sagmatias obliquidens TaxID=3371155 RepID=UPI000F43E5E1|nr:mucin-6 [Lagenorhynchus obliquidens]
MLGPQLLLLLSCGGALLSADSGAAGPGGDQAEPRAERSELGRLVLGDSRRKQRHRAFLRQRPERREADREEGSKETAPFRAQKREKSSAGLSLTQPLSWRQSAHGPQREWTRGLDDSSLVPPGLRRLKDSPQTGGPGNWEASCLPVRAPRGPRPAPPAGRTQGPETPPAPSAAPDRGWCSTWGPGHFTTFDGHTYDFSGTCNYIFAATCKDASSTFSVQLRRGPSGNISRVIVELGASVVTVQKAVISVKDVGVVSLPYTSNGLQITPFGQSVRLVAKQLELELVVMWGPGAHLMVLVEKKHMGKMCGLCGNFDGEKANEFLSEDGQLLEPPKYATLQKLDDPNEICAYEAIPSPRVPQAENAQTCIQLLTLVSRECNVPKEPFLLSCQADMATCAQPGQHHCSCATLSEYSRQCSMAGQPVNSWRGPGLCSVGQCPANQVYRECGKTCVQTCSNPRRSCSGFCTFGCFCPEGMVLDDISKNHSCVPVPQCPCMLSGVVFAPGEVTTAACQTCRCSGGRWECVEQPCPRRCALEGGSFVTTFDARPYRFHGTCTYILLQSPQLPDGGSLMAVYDKSGYSHSETSLVAVIYVSSQDKIVISQDEVITNNGDTKRLPYETRNITVFRQTSTHLQMVTTFGLELVIQLWPLFQVYITAGPQFRGQTRGLCGNFNGDTTDDFTTSMGITEGTASLFVDSWRAGNCPAARERETDPCSMSQLNKVCAETHCAVLVKKGTVFERCHTAVDPKPFYKRCVYQACNYEETFPHICAALGDYALTCTSRGVLLPGWRSSVDNCSTPCTGNQTFSYDSQACDRTCLSLSDREVECHPSAVPVDGCNCPEGTYLNHKAECVREAQCPCLLDSSKFILADQSTMVNGVICYCVNGRLSCPAQPQMLLATCSAPKTFQSCSQSSENKFGAACAPTCQMLATGTPCVPTKCEPGCVCAKGLYENASGQCVPPEECPCEFAGVSYPQGAELHTDCKSCICSRGTWTCQQSAHCPSTCTLYGEGHVVTFDGQRFVFDGNCEYILATDGCGASDSQPTFKILTENVVCGKSGVTCSRAIKIFLGGLSIVLADGNYTVSGEDPGVDFRVKAGSLHLVLDATVSSTYNLTLIWNKHMTVFIKIARASQDALCGLCGNYNGNMKDDFQTRSKYLASSELEFVNSWKESPLCGDTTFTQDPCSLNAFRRSWAERKCSIINSQTFAACHGQVYRLPYYEACVRDTCGCDTGGDCECLCDAVAAYAKACVDKGVCVDWRSPDFCPIYCDFYNTHTQAGGGKHQHAQEASCTWHYQPCLCPALLQSFPGPNIEGCYNCSQNEYFDHDKGMCLPCSKLTAPYPTTTACVPHSGSHSTETRPTTAAASTTVTPSTPALSSTRPSPSSPATPEAPTRTPSLPATPTATATAPTTQTQPTVPSGGLPQTTSTVTTRATSAPTTTATRRPTATAPTVTQATTQPAGSSHDTATRSTARSTARTTAAPPTPATSGTSTVSPASKHATTARPHRGASAGQPQHPAQAMWGRVEDSSLGPPPRPHRTGSGPREAAACLTQHAPLCTSPPPRYPSAHPPRPPPPRESTGPRGSRAPKGPQPKCRPRLWGSAPNLRFSLTHTATATPPMPHTPFTTHSTPTLSVPTTTHTTGPPTGTPFWTATTYPTPSHPQTLPPNVSTSATSLVAPTSHRVTSMDPATDKDHNKDLHTHNPATDKDHNRDHHTQNTTTDKDNRDHHTHSHTTDKDNRDHHTQNTTTHKDHNRDHHTHSHNTDKDHNRDHHTQNLATDKDHNRDLHTQNPATDKDHNRDHYTHNPATDKDHNRDCRTHSPATDQDHNRDCRTHHPATDRDHNRDRHTQNSATDKEHKRDHHTHSTTTPTPPPLTKRGTTTPTAPPLTKTTTGTTRAQNSVSTYRGPVYIPDHTQQAHLLSSVLSVHYLKVHLSHDPRPHAGPPVFHPGSDSHPKFPSHQPHHQTAKYHRAAGQRTCSVREFEEEVTYQGCTANVTVTRCEGVCASSASFNTDTMQVDTKCSCCHPLGSHEKQLVLPCPDPRVRGRRLTLTLQVFSSCTCRSQRCGD